MRVCVCERERECAAFVSVRSREENEDSGSFSLALCIIVCERGGQSSSLALCARARVCVRGVFERGKSRCS